jgi:hypothetical protein
MINKDLKMEGMLTPAELKKKKKETFLTRLDLYKIELKEIIEGLEEYRIDIGKKGMFVVVDDTRIIWKVRILNYQNRVITHKTEIKIKPYESNGRFAKWNFEEEKIDWFWEGGSIEY